MSKKKDFIDDDLAAWLRRQQVFFVATAPDGGHLNCSPKGGDCFRILGPTEVAYSGLHGQRSGNGGASAGKWADCVDVLRVRRQA